jgi:hypothetical protein
MEPLGCAEDADADAFAVVAQAMTFADNLIVFDRADAQRNAAMMADIARRR